MWGEECSMSEERAFPWVSSLLSINSSQCVYTVQQRVNLFLEFVMVCLRRAFNLCNLKEILKEYMSASFENVPLLWSQGSQAESRYEYCWLSVQLRLPNRLAKYKECIENGKSPSGLWNVIRCSINTCMCKIFFEVEKEQIEIVWQNFSHFTLVTLNCT